MSDTPRTDNKAFGKRVMANEMVNAEFARELERENAELRKDKERLDKRNSNLVATCVMLQFKLQKETARLDWIDRTIDGLSRQDVDKEMKGEQ